MHASSLEVRVSAPQESSSIVNLISHLDQLENEVGLKLSTCLYNVPKRRFFTPHGNQCFSAKADTSKDRGDSL